MQTSGWIMMILSVGTVTCLFGWCLIKVLTLAPRDAEKHLHGDLDIDTHEQD